MFKRLKDNGTLGAVLAGAFVLAIVAGTAAVAVPAWSQTPDQEEDAAAIESRQARWERARADWARGAEGRERMAHSRGRRGGARGGAFGTRRGRAGIGGGRFDIASRALGRAEEIGLTDAQKDQIESARDTHRRQQVERDAAAQLLRLDLGELLKDEASDLTAVEQKMREGADLKVQEQMAALRYRRDVQGILTAEQVEQLREIGAESLRRRAPEDRAPRTQRQR